MQVPLIDIFSLIWLRSGLRDSLPKADVPILTDDKNPLISTLLYIIILF